MARTGTILHIHDSGTIVQLYLLEAAEHPARCRPAVVAGDGNLTRRALTAAFGRYYDVGAVGKRIEFERESWGGMKWFRPLDGEEA